MHGLPHVLSADLATIMQVSASTVLPTDIFGIQISIASHYYHNASFGRGFNASGVEVDGKT